MTLAATKLQVWCNQCGDYRPYRADGICATCSYPGGTDEPPRRVSCTVTRRPRDVALTAICDICMEQVADVRYYCGFVLCDARCDTKPVPRLVNETTQHLLDLDGEPDLDEGIRRKLAIMRRDHWTCFYCGRWQGELSAVGVLLDVDGRNHVAACEECKSRIKGMVVQLALDIGIDDTETLTDAA